MTKRTATVMGVAFVWGGVCGVVGALAVKSFVWGLLAAVAASAVAGATVAGAAIWWTSRRARSGGSRQSAAR